MEYAGYEEVGGYSKPGDALPAAQRRPLEDEDEEEEYYDEVNDETKWHQKAKVHTEYEGDTNIYLYDYGSSDGEGEDEETDNDAPNYENVDQQPATPKKVLVGGFDDYAIPEKRH